MKQFPVISPARITLLASLITSGAVLTACGGGGSSDSSVNATANVATVSPVADEPTAPTAHILAIDERSSTFDIGAEATTGYGQAASLDVAINASAGDAVSATVAMDVADLKNKIAVAQTAADGVVAGEFGIYVETSGSDSNSGASQASTGSDGPVKTISRAQQIARAKIAAMASGSVTRAAVRVVIGPH